MKPVQKSLRKQLKWPLVILIFLIGFVCSNAILRLWPKPVMEGPCLSSMPEEGMLTVFEFESCPIGYMELEDVRPIASFRQGWIERRYPFVVYGPGYNQEAVATETGGVGMYEKSTDESPTLAVYWLKESKVFAVDAAGLESDQYYDDNGSLTACLGMADEVLCISILQWHYWYWPSNLNAYIWVGWISRDAAHP